MIKHLIKITVRTIVKYKFYSTINILGLAIGIAGFIMIVLYINHELGYDKFHRNSERIFRVGTITRLSDNEIVAATSPGPLAEALMNDVPEVAVSTRIFPITDAIITQYEDKVFNETSFLADANFFKIFSFELLEGNPDKALVEPFSLVLTQEAARKYFGREKALGKMMTIGNSSAKVTGVIKNIPANSHFHFDILISLSTDPSRLHSNAWGLNDFYTYFLIKEKASSNELEDKLGNFVVKYVSPVLKNRLGYSDEKIKSQRVWEYFIQALTDIHLKSNLSQELEPNGNSIYIYILSIVAFLIILAACINYMNFSTSYSTNRAKEIGVRKVLGSEKKLLVKQFLLESIILNVFATLLALGIVFLLLPVFNNIIGKRLAFDFLENTWLVFGILILPFLVGAVSGSYPAFYFSSLKPVHVLKGKPNTGKKARGVRNALVTFQLIISMCLIICTLQVYQQLQFLRDKNLGFDKENVIVIRNNFDKFSNRNEQFKQELLALPQVVKVSNSFTIPGKGTAINNLAMREYNTEEDIVLFWFYADFDFVETYKIDIIMGRNFSREIQSDTEGVLLNETAVKQFGFENPIGKILVFPGREREKLEVIGVMKDFNFESLQAKIRPVALTLDEGGNYISIRIRPENLTNTVEDLEAHWKSFSNNSPFDYFFLDQSFDTLFKAEQRLGKVGIIFTFLSIFVSCLGLFGLISLTAEQRAKEISIRKVLGSTAVDIFFLLSKDFTRLVIFANLLAIPLSYFLIKKWLEGFAYQTLIRPEIFILGILIEFFIVFFVISFQIFKVSKANPIRHINT